MPLCDHAAYTVPSLSIAGTAPSVVSSPSRQSPGTSLMRTAGYHVLPASEDALNMMFDLCEGLFDPYLSNCVHVTHMNGFEG